MKINKFTLFLLIFLVFQINFINSQTNHIYYSETLTVNTTYTWHFMNNSPSMNYTHGLSNSSLINLNIEQSLASVNTLDMDLPNFKSLYSVEVNNNTIETSGSTDSFMFDLEFYQNGSQVNSTSIVLVLPIHHFDGEEITFYEYYRNLDELNPINIIDNGTQLIFDETDIGGPLRVFSTETGVLEYMSIYQNQSLLADLTLKFHNPGNPINTSPISSDQTSDDPTNLNENIQTENPNLTARFDIKFNMKLLGAIIILGTVGFGGYQGFVQYKIHAQIISESTFKLLNSTYGQLTSSLLGLAKSVSNNNYDPNKSIPQELFSFKFILHPVRLGIMKLLTENTILTTTELKTAMDVSWTELNNHLKALKKKEYVTTESQFIDNSVKVVVNLEPHGISAFQALGEILVEFFDETEF